MCVKRMKIRKAKRLGYMVDTTCYPHFGYVGDRFDPTRSIAVFTELESKLIEKLIDLEAVMTGSDPKTKGRFLEELGIELI